MTDKWIETELWNFVRGAAIDLMLSPSGEEILYENMKIVIGVHSRWAQSEAVRELEGGK